MGGGHVHHSETLAVGDLQWRSGAEVPVCSSGCSSSHLAHSGGEVGEEQVLLVGVGTNSTAVFSLHPHNQQVLEDTIPASYHILNISISLYCTSAQANFLKLKSK